MVDLPVAMRQLKDRNGLSLKSLEAKTPFSRSSWERYLNGKQFPPRQALRALCGAARAERGRGTRTVGTRRRDLERTRPHGTTSVCPALPSGLRRGRYHRIPYRERHGRPRGSRRGDRHASRRRPRPVVRPLLRLPAPAPDGGLRLDHRPPPQRGGHGGAAVRGGDHFRRRDPRVPGLGSGIRVPPARVPARDL
ncbi:helix-turn-helix transcriptional regulator [Streptomyces sp. NPDC005202]|uniref:helix-turn-helix domain-containing protein n=1 Tax=Streptomyces sp. NPDC005202 TaxID=3157021 RepID=UPI0033BE22D6